MRRKEARGNRLKVSSRFFLLATSLIHWPQFWLRSLPLLLQLLRQIVKLALFHVLRDVRIDVHGGIKIGMTKDLLDDLDIDAILKQAGREGVPLWHNKDKSENPCGARVKGDRELFPQRAA